MRWGAHRHAVRRLRAGWSPSRHFAMNRHCRPGGRAPRATGRPACWPRRCGPAAHGPRRVADCAHRHGCSTRASRRFLPSAKCSPAIASCSGCRGGLNSVQISRVIGCTAQIGLNAFSANWPCLRIEQACREGSSISWFAGPCMVQQDRVDRVVGRPAQCRRRVPVVGRQMRASEARCGADRREEDFEKRIQGLALHRRRHGCAVAARRTEVAQCRAGQRSGAPARAAGWRPQSIARARRARCNSSVAFSGRPSWRSKRSRAMAISFLANAGVVAKVEDSGVGSSPSRCLHRSVGHNGSDGARRKAAVGILLKLPWRHAKGLVRTRVDSSLRAQRVWMARGSTRAAG